MGKVEELLSDVFEHVGLAVSIEALGGEAVYRNAAARQLDREIEREPSAGMARQAWRQARERVLQTHRVETFEVRYTRGDRVHIYRGRIEVVGGRLLTQMQDRTDTEQARRELRAFIDTSPQLPWTSDAQGWILDAGSRWEEWTGLRIAEGLGSRWLDAVHPDDCGWVADRWSTHTLTHQDLDFEYRLRSASGRYRWVRARATPYFGPAGHVERWYGTLEDVDDRRMAMEALAESEQRFRAIADDAPVVMWVVDAEGANIYHSRLWTEMTGQPAEIARGSGWLDPIHPEDRDRVLDLHERAFAARTSVEVEYRLRRSDGSWAFVLDFGRPRFTPSGDFVGYVGSVLDITDRRAAEEGRIEAQRQILHMARHDMLTGLPNRARFAEHLESLRGVFSADEPVAVLLLDLDGFKAINDSLGHPTGDALLRQVAERLRSHVREGDLVARFGGDEFALVVHPVSGPDQARALARRLTEAFLKPLAVGERHLTVGMSIGAAVSPRAGRTGDELIAAADIALYEAKRGGRNTFRIFDPEMDAVQRRRQNTQAALSAAIQERQFLLHYQPMLDLASDRTVGYEALLRWQHPQEGVIGPAEFIELAEESGLIIPLGGWVIRQALWDISQCETPSATVAVNLSPVQFSDNTIVRTVSEALAQAEVAPGRLQLEITESVLLHANENNLSQLRDLRAMGIKLALDDFGTGYSSLSYLRQFQFDKIKLDRSFMRDLHGGEHEAAIVNAVVGLGKALSITTTAEGIETAAQLDLVRRAGFDEGQGYLIGRPGPRPW